MDMKRKNDDALNECILEARRFLDRCERAKRRPTADLGPDNTAVVRSALDLRRIMSRYSRRYSGSNYAKEWKDCD